MANAAVSVGYSGKALFQKLGLASAQRLLVIDPPARLDTLLHGAPDDLVRLRRLCAFDVPLVFVISRDALAKALVKLLPRLADHGMIWVCWPKRTSGASTDVTEDGVRAVALPMGLVDVKVCAVDGTWSGLKLCRRRTQPPTASKKKGSAKKASAPQPKVT